MIAFPAGVRVWIAGGVVGVDPDRLVLDREIAAAEGRRIVRQLRVTTAKGL